MPIDCWAASGKTVVVSLVSYADYGNPAYSVTDQKAVQERLLLPACGSCRRSGRTAGASARSQGCIFCYPRILSI